MAGYSFASLPFSPAAKQELMARVQPPEPKFSIRWVPNSDRSVIHKGGFGPRRFQSEIRVDPSAEGNWEDALLLTGTLEVDSIQWENATLVSLVNNGLTPNGEYVFFTAQWVIPAGV